MEIRSNDYPPQPDRNQPTHEGRKGYIDLLSSIRADQDRKIFDDDLRQNGEPLIAFARDLRASALKEESKTDREDKFALGVFIEATLKKGFFDHGLYKFKVPDTVSDMDSDDNDPLKIHHVLGYKSPEPWRPGLDPFEYVPQGKNPLLWREGFAQWATQRVALKWIDDHPGSAAANWVLARNKSGSYDPGQLLLREMWLSIRDIAGELENNK